MAKILFVENNLRVDKLGILYLSAVLKKLGHDTRLVQAEREQLHTVMSLYKPDFVMYSLMTGEHQWFIQTNRKLKTEFEFISVFGGPHPTFFPEQSENDPAVDYIVRGPGELVIGSLVEHRIFPKIIMGVIPPVLDALPPPDRSILYKYDDFGSSGIRRFIASRDCKNACAYCFNHIFHREFKSQKCYFFQRLAPEHMVDEILNVRKEWGLGMTYMNDDNLVEDAEWLKVFCREYKERVYDPFGIPFCGSVRADSVSPWELQQMAEAGCTFLNIALESSQPKTQKILRRGRITNRDVERACRACRKHGIKVRLQNMIGLPVDNPLEDALLTFEYNKKLNPEDSWAAIFQPFPKTDLWHHCVDKGFITEDDECMNFYDDTVLRIPDAEKINCLHKWWHPAVKHKVPREFLEFLLEIPLTSEQKRSIQERRWSKSAKELYGDAK